MSIQALIEKINEAFPDLDIKETDIQAHRPTVMRDFYWTFLNDFNVDMENIKRVQLGQLVTEDNEMIPTINLNCAINCILPYNPISLFNLINPSLAIMSTKISAAIQFYKFCDDIMISLFEIRDPFIKAKRNAVKLVSDFDSVSMNTNRTMMKTKNNLSLLEETEKEYASVEESHMSVIEDKRKLELEIQNFTAQKEMLLRKKQICKNSLLEVEGKLNARKSIMHYSSDCNVQLEKCELELDEVNLKKNQIQEKIDGERKSHPELMKLQETLAERCSAINKILKIQAKVRSLKEVLHEKNTNCTEGIDSMKLEEINKSISKQQIDNDNLVKTHSREIKQILNSIKNTEENDISEEIKCDLQMKLKTKLNEITSEDNKLADLEVEVKNVKENFALEEKKLIKMETDMVKPYKEEIEKWHVASTNMARRCLSLKQQN